MYTSTCLLLRVRTPSHHSQMSWHFQIILMVCGLPLGNTFTTKVILRILCLHFSGGIKWPWDNFCCLNSAQGPLSGCSKKRLPQRLTLEIHHYRRYTAVPYIEWKCLHFDKFLIFGCAANLITFSAATLQWHHNEPDGISNHQPHDCLLNHLYRRS